jgi:hypothetical protein
MKRSIVALACILGLSALTIDGAAASVRHEPGIGAKVTAWKHAYGISKGPGVLCSKKYPCFGPRVHNGDSGNTYEFTQVGVAGGVVFDYTENFPKDTNVAEVEASISKTLPKDAPLGPIVVGRMEGTCGLINAMSPTLLKELDTPKIGDTTGAVGILLEHLTASLGIAYSPHNIQTVMVGPIAENPALGC